MAGHLFRYGTMPRSRRLLDAFPGHAAVLDSDGCVTAVNDAWRSYAAENGGAPAGTGRGVNYVQVCDRAAAAGDVEGERAGAALRSVLRGSTSSFSSTYPCPAPGREQWFTLRFTAIGGSRARVLVTHEDTTIQHDLVQGLERRASQDPLTGLVNRLVLTRALAAALSGGHRTGGHERVGLVYIDLDDFKAVNDHYGHSVGDEVLRSVARRLLGLSGPDDTVARLGGDEFALCLPALTVDGFRGLAARIGQELALPHDVPGRQLSVSASVGAHLATAGADVEDSMDRADAVMYAQKRLRRNDSEHLRDHSECPPPR